MKKSALSVVAVVALTLFMACSSSVPEVTTQTAVIDRPEQPGGLPEEPTYKVVSWVLQDPDSISVIEVNSAEPDVTHDRYETVTIGETHRVLYRLSLLVGIDAENIESAYFLMKPKNNGTVPALRLSIMRKDWVSYSTDEEYGHFSIPPTWEGVNKYIAENLETKQTTDNGWYSIDVTDLLKDWFFGTYENFGFMLSSDSATDFYSIESSFCPKLIINYRETETLSYGKFISFEEQYWGYGNCLSFVLRDYETITGRDIMLKEAELKETYNEGGLDAMLQYIKKVIIQYVKKHKDELKITDFREIDSFNAPIDPKVEYRIALRVGAEQDTEGELGYDYHLMAQLANGSWAEKNPSERARLIPGFHAGFDPGQSPWSRGYTRLDAFYNSKTVYFAVSKSVDAFTGHE